MGVSREEIRRIAELAELEVDDRLAAELEGQLSRILDYVAQLGELPRDAEDEADARAVRLRRDEPWADPLLRPIRSFAPELRGDLFVVPRLGELAQGEDE